MVHVKKAGTFAVSVLMLLMSLMVIQSANAIVLRTDYDNAAGTYCNSSLDLNYYYCLDSVRKCVSHFYSIKSGKSFMTEEERAALILDRCFINNADRFTESAFSEQ